MVIRSVNLETVCGVTSRLPEHDMPEFAFAGKSNVGKSTLINGIMNRKNYARTSAQPGKTQTINFYNVNDEFYLVDLPGYGYTNASVEVKEQWGRMIERYLKKSRALKAVFLLLDIRHEPSANDVLMYDWILKAGFTPVIVATKADKIKRSQLAGQQKLLRSTLAEKSGVLPPGSGEEKRMKVIAWSGLSKAGREEIYELLDELLTEQDDRSEEMKDSGNVSPEE